MNKNLKSLATIILGAWLSFGAGTALTPSAHATVADSTNQPTLFANVPKCTAANDMSRAAITDGPASPNFGQIVGNGGGTSHDLILCNGTASTPVWIVYGGGVGAAPVANVLKAPTTAQGNYATGCSGTPYINDGAHNCLSFDDHWTAASLNTAHWYAGLNFCNNGSAENCGLVPGAGSSNYPVTGWCWGAVNGCQDFATWDFPYGYGNNPFNLTPALTRASDGSLAFAVKLYSTTRDFPGGVGDVPSTNPIATSSSYCTTVSNYANCAYIYWTGAAITSGGMSCTNCYPATMNDLSSLIPSNGGMVQWRMKLDQGLKYGAYPIMECDAVGGNYSGTSSNANLEFGYNDHNTDGTTSIGLGLNNVANQTSSGVFVTTGDDGVGSGNLTNWHTFALEYTGNTTHQWHYYIDGVEQSVVTHNEPNTPTVGFNCKFVMGIAQNGTNGSFHTLWSPANPGPFYMYISDTQFYKKPGT